MLSKLNLELKLLSWEKCFSNLLRLQKRIFKSVLVGDIISAYRLQSLLLCSNSSRLLAIRLATRLTDKSYFFDVDKKPFLSVTERFLLNSILKKEVFKWRPRKYINLVYITKDGLSINLKVPGLIDRCWQVLIQFALEPAHQAIFSPRSLEFNSSFGNYRVQHLIYLNLQFSSFGYQKRLLRIDFSNCLNKFNLNLFLKKIISFNDVKVSLFLSFFSGLSFNCICIPELERCFPFPFFLLNILLHGLEFFYDGVRYGPVLICFLLPLSSESLTIEKILNFISNIDLDHSKKFVNLYSVESGFNFLFWHFKVVNKSCVIRPSLDSFNLFFRRVKNVITNSNYGAVCFSKCDLMD